jgi:hypothetical protein
MVPPDIIKIKIDSMTTAASSPKHPIIPTERSSPSSKVSLPRLRKVQGHSLGRRHTDPSSDDNSSPLSSKWKLQNLFIDRYNQNRPKIRT